MAAQVLYGELTKVEQLLIEHVGRGEWLDLAGGKAADETAMRSWGDERACRAVVIRDVLRGRLAPGPDPHGLRLRGARIIGRLDLENLTSDVNLELKDCLLEEGLLARDAQLASVSLIGCQIEHHTEPPLDATRLICSVLAISGARIIGHARDGAVRLVGGHIGGQLACDGAALRNDSGSAMIADGLKVDQGMFLRGGDRDGKAFKFMAIGSAEIGTVRLAGAHIGGQLDCTLAEVCNDAGPALHAESVFVGRIMRLAGRFTGSGNNGAVSLANAHIGGRFDCTGAELRNETGPALAAEGLQVDQSMSLSGGFTAMGAGDGVAVDLTGARVGATFQFDPATLEHAAEDRRRIRADGLTYAGVPALVLPRDWLGLLRDGTPTFAAQPYQQLAAGYRALGDERLAREILMAQRDDELARVRPRWPERLWGRITKVTLGYGYQPWRALLFLIGVVALSCVLAVLLGSHGALAQTDKTATPGQPCTTIQQVSVGLDLNLPVGTSIGRASCDLTKDSASATATWLTAAGWALRVLAWMFAALFVAGFTSAVRRS